MPRKPRRTICRTKLAKRMHVRIPPTSYSLRMVVLAVCQHQDVPLAALAKLESRVLAKNSDVETWTALTSTIDKGHVLQALQSVCERAQTGPVTSFVVQGLVDALRYEQRERAEARRNASSAERAKQRHGQAFLAACEQGGWLDHGATVGWFV